MKFAAVSLALLGTSVVQGLTTPANYGNAVQARQVEGSLEGIGDLTVTIGDLIDSLTDLSTGTIGTASDAVNSAIGTAAELIATITADLPTISKRQADVPAVLARLNAIIDNLQVQASVLTGIALATANNLINQVQAIINSLAAQAAAPI